MRVDHASFYPELKTPPRLEDDYSEPLTAYQRQPTPQNADRLLAAVEPHITRGIKAHVGQDNPLLRSRAKRLVLDSLPRYNPRQSALGTFVINQLQGLKRISRKQQQVLSIPERVQLDQQYLHRVELELADELDREPSAAELADRSGLSLKRIRHVRQFQPGMTEGALAQRVESSSDDAVFEMPGVASESTAWRDVIYQEVDPINKKIMEYSFGLFGSPMLSTTQIAARLRITPGAVSQRKAQIQKLLDEALF